MHSCHDAGVTRPTSAQIALVRRLLAHESAAVRPPSGDAAAAGRLHEKLTAQLDPLLGTAGVRLLLVRSAKLSQQEAVCLADASLVQQSTTLRERLQAEDPAVASRAAEALFATFIALLDTFIGERMTAQVLRRAWPTIDHSASSETNQ